MLQIHAARQSWNLYFELREPLKRNKWKMEVTSQCQHIQYSSLLFMWFTRNSHCVEKMHIFFQARKFLHNSPFSYTQTNFLSDVRNYEKEWMWMPLKQSIIHLCLNRSGHGEFVKASVITTATFNITHSSEFEGAAYYKARNKCLMRNILLFLSQLHIKSQLNLVKGQKLNVSQN